MDKSKKIVIIVSSAVFFLLTGFTIYRWMRYGTIDGGSIFFSFLALSYLLNWLNWGDHEGSGKKDELGQHIEAQSAKIAYFVLMILSGIILFVSEGVSNLNDIKNFPLLLVVCLTFVTLPVTEFIYARKYK